MKINKKDIIRLVVVGFLLLTIPISVFVLNRETNLLSRALGEIFGTRAEITINLTDSYPVNSYVWSNFAQGGEEREGMLTPVVGLVSNLQPEYIRIDHVFDFYDVVAKGPQNELVYNWSRLDSEIGDILATGAKPFISLSYMPQALSKGDEVDVPVNWDEWRQLVKNTIEHVSGRGGLAIEDVYYEVWNEPDLFGGFKVYGEKNYLTLYRYSALGAQDAQNVLPFKFGGPATTALYKGWFDGLLKYSSDNDLRLDFYSWHKYSVKIDDFERDIRKAREWIMAHPKFFDIEMIISEAGHNSENDIGFDNNFAAVHALAMSAVTFQQINKVFSFEIKDGPGEKQYWGRWGMITHENFGEPTIKPRYKAFEFLKGLEGERYVVFGQGTWVKAIAAKVNGNIKVMLVNYDPYSGHTETVPINFVNLPTSDFIFRKTTFMGATTESSVKLDENNWTVRELMSPNSAVLLEIIPQ